MAGTLALVFFTSAMQIDQAVDLFVEPLQQAAAAASCDMAEVGLAAVSQDASA